MHSCFEPIDKETMRVFISSENVDEYPAYVLIERLIHEGWEVEHSPRNSDVEHDEGRDDWYEKELSLSVSRADVFIIVLNKRWDSSTWMGRESNAAKLLMDYNDKPDMFYWNPSGVTNITREMKIYLKQRLPNDLDDAILTLTP